MDSKEKDTELTRSSRRRFLRGTALAGLAAAGGVRPLLAQDWLKKLPPLPDQGAHRLRARRIRAQGPRLARPVDRRTDAGRCGRTGRGLDRHPAVGHLPKECPGRGRPTVWGRGKGLPPLRRSLPVRDLASPRHRRRVGRRLLGHPHGAQHDQGTFPLDGDAARTSNGDHHAQRAPFPG